MTDHLDKRFTKVRTPERDSTIRMTHCKNSILRVLIERVRLSLLGVHFSDNLSSSNVLVFKMTSLGCRAKQEVVREVFKKLGFNMVLHGVNLDSLVIVDVQIFLLSHCKHTLIL